MTEVMKDAKDTAVGTQGPPWTTWRGGDCRVEALLLLTLGTLTRHSEGHGQQDGLLEALVLHSAGDVLAVRLAGGHDGQEADDIGCARQVSWHQALIGLPARE